MQLFERLCATFLHTMPHLFPPAVSIVVKMSSLHCRMQKEGGILMRLPWQSVSRRRPLLAGASLFSRENYYLCLGSMKIRCLLLRK